MSTPDEIAALLEARAVAIARRDVDAVMAQIAEDVVSFEVGVPLYQSGATSVRQELETWFARYDGPIGFDTQCRKVYGDGDVAFSHALVHVHGELKSGARASMWVRSTIGWVRRDGHWTAVHEHMSDPMDFETGMARTDLTP